MSLRYLSILTLCLVALIACPDDGEGDHLSHPSSLVGRPRVYPAMGHRDGGERVQIHHPELETLLTSPPLTIQFGDAPAREALVQGPRQIDVTTPAHAPGLVSVTLSNATDDRLTLPRAFLYRAPFALHSHSPTSAPMEGGGTLRIHGEGFDGDFRVLIGGHFSPAIRILDAHTLEAQIPPRNHRDGPGTVDIILTDGHEQRTLEATFTYLPTPTLHTLHPAAIPPDLGLELTVLGTGFTPDTLVLLNDTPLDTLALTSERLLVRVPPLPQGQYDLLLQNDSAQQRTPKALSVISPGPTPSVHPPTPSGGDTSGGQPLSLHVTGLQAAPLPRVMFGAHEAELLEFLPHLDTLLVRVPAGPVGQSDAPIRVEQGTLSLQGATYRYHGLEVESVSPARLPQRGGPVRLKGSGFDAQLSLWLGSEPLQITHHSEHELLFLAPPRPSGRYDLRLEGPDHTFVAPDALHYTSHRAKIWAASPPYGPLTGDRLVRLYGEGLSIQPQIHLHGEDALDIQGHDDHLLTFRTPAADPGQVTIHAGALGDLLMAHEYRNTGGRRTQARGGAIADALTITVIDRLTRRPLPGAYIAIDTGDDMGPRGWTDHRGQLTLSDFALVPPHAITATADDYSTETLAGFDATDLTLSLIPLSLPEPEDDDDDGDDDDPPPTRLPRASLEGRVARIDKHTLRPPGQCDRLLEHESSPHCGPCLHDTDCPGAAVCTHLPGQGPRCTSPCQEHAACEPGYECQAFDDGGRCVPNPGETISFCQGTQDGLLESNALPFGVIQGDQSYHLDLEPGEHTIACFEGVLEPDTGRFTPLAMGLKRQISLRPGQHLKDLNIVLDIPLNTSLRVRLDAAPTGNPRSLIHRAGLMLDLGPEGYLQLPHFAEGEDQNSFVMDGFPEAFGPELYDAQIVAFGSAESDNDALRDLGVGSFAIQEDIAELRASSLYSLDPAASLQPPVQAEALRSGIFAMHHTGDESWAVGERGQVLHHDGDAWWQVESPTDHTLHAVWAASDGRIWVTGEAGTLFIHDELGWAPLDSPLPNFRGGWRGIRGYESDEGVMLWLWGEAGLYRALLRASEAIRWHKVPLSDDGAVYDLWPLDGYDYLWVGRDGSAARHFQGGVLSLDLPGPDLLGLHLDHAGEGWAVGREGRILYWDGVDFEELSPVGHQDLHAVVAMDAYEAWAVGDAGQLLRWNGRHWRGVAGARQPRHVDLRALIAPTDGGLWLGGLPTLVIGPFIGLPTSEDFENRPGYLEWGGEGPMASLNWIRLEIFGFPFWNILSTDERQRVVLPDFQREVQIPAMWPGSYRAWFYRIAVPHFDPASWDETILYQERWRAWSFDILGYASERSR